MLKNPIKELIKNLDDIEAEINPISESTTDQVIDIWYREYSGNFHIVKDENDEIIVANLNIPGQPFETLQTNTKTKRLAKLILEKVGQQHG